VFIYCFYLLHYLTVIYICMYVRASVRVVFHNLLFAHWAEPPTPVQFGWVCVISRTIIQIIAFRILFPFSTHQIITDFPLLIRFLLFVFWHSISWFRYFADFHSGSVPLFPFVSWYFDSFFPRTHNSAHEPRKSSALFQISFVVIIILLIITNFFTSPFDQLICSLEVEKLRC